MHVCQSQAGLVVLVVGGGGGGGNLSVDVVFLMPFANLGCVAIVAACCWCRTACNLLMSGPEPAAPVCRPNYLRALEPVLLPEKVRWRRGISW